jgi:hypothetical protein
MAYTRLEIHGVSATEGTYTLVIEGDVDDVIQDYSKIQKSEVFTDVE